MFVNYSKLSAKITITALICHKTTERMLSFFLYVAPLRKFFIEIIVEVPGS